MGIQEYQFKTRLINVIGTLTLISALSACDPGTPSGQTDFTVGGAAAPLTQKEFDKLPPEQQYQVASKLYGTLLRGIPVDEFFDLSSGTETLTVKKTNFINDTRNKLSKNLPLDVISEYDRAIDGLDENLSNPDPEQARYEFDPRSDKSISERPRQLPMARIRDYPISRDLYVNWMAYFLANTVMYSPAEEMESSDMQDVQRMYRFLYSNINEKASIRQMVRSNLSSLARWRVARTPQNAGLEAFENYLGLFQDGSLTDAEKAKNPVIANLPQSIENVGVACRDLYLTPGDEYLIAQTDFPNTSPLLILEDSFVTTCPDFYDAVAGSNLITPRAVEVIINYFMPGEAAREARLAVRDAIVKANPETYEDIFTAILFSREYLLNGHRPRSFEETLFPLFDSLKWDVKANVGAIGKDIFDDMTRVNDSTNLSRMNWQTMRLKIGRLPSVPLDALSFANYHKAIREALLTDSRSYRGGFNDAGNGLFCKAESAKNCSTEDDLLDSVRNMKVEEYIDYLFLSALHRKATADEQTALFNYLVFEKDYTKTISVNGVAVHMIRSNRYDDLTEEVFDYISRLPELYYFSSVDTSNGGV